MPERTVSDFELMHMHLQALYQYDTESRLVSTNEWHPQPAPRFCLGRTKQGNLWRFHRDLPPALVSQLESNGALDRRAEVMSREPGCRDQYIALLASNHPIAPWSGPAYCFSAPFAERSQAVEITPANADLLKGGLEDWLVDVPHLQPMMALIEADHAVSICASVRITNEAHEAGVETLPGYRRKGLACRVVAAWANALFKMDVLPLYSTSWDNIASQHVASHLGLTLYGVDFHIT